MLHLYTNRTEGLLDLESQPATHLPCRLGIFTLTWVLIRKPTLDADAISVKDEGSVKLVLRKGEGCLCFLLALIKRSQPRLKAASLDWSAEPCDQHFILT